jgi:hypothetical protein
MSNPFASKTVEEPKQEVTIFTAKESPFNKHLKGEGNPTDYVLDKKAIQLVEAWD